MTDDVFIAGVGMTPFRRTPGRGVRELAVAAIDEALADAGVDASEVQRIFMGNAAAGTVSQQDMIRGQVALRNTALAGLPLINVENACASGSSALNLAWEAVGSGRCDVALAVGAEQLTHAEKSRTFMALRGSTDIDEIGEVEAAAAGSSSILMEFYAEEAASYLERTGATPADLALVAVKNRRHGALNPLAQYGTPQTVEEVLNSRMIVAPLTLAMCSPTTDGAAALVVVSPDFAAKRLPGSKLRILASEVAGGRVDSPVEEASAAAYRAAGLGPGDLDFVELHDAAAPAELIQYGEIGLCAPDEAHQILRRGETALGGRIPVNTSGGLMSRGHPLGATGIAQLAELCTQLRGRAGDRQVRDARIGMAVNGGGWLGGQYAVSVATIITVDA
jgi:acetyl-CoA acetyltransferase